MVTGVLLRRYFYFNRGNYYVDSGGYISKDMVSQDFFDGDLKDKSPKNMLKVYFSLDGLLQCTRSLS